MTQNLNNAYWEYTKKKAVLIAESSPLIEIEFGRKATFIRFGNEKYNIMKDGFWCPRIMITKNDSVLVIQKQVGLWNTKSEFVIDDKTYTATTRQDAAFNITYTRGSRDILTYILDASKNTSSIIFQIISANVPEQHLLLLLALGFYSIRNVANEAINNDLLLTAIA